MSILSSHFPAILTIVKHESFFILIPDNESYLGPPLTIFFYLYTYHSHVQLTTVQKSEKSGFRFRRPLFSASMIVIFLSESWPQPIPSKKIRKAKPLTTQSNTPWTVTNDLAHLLEECLFLHMVDFCHVYAQGIKDRFQGQIIFF